MKKTGFVATMMTATLGLGALMATTAEGTQIDDQAMVQAMTNAGTDPLTTSQELTAADLSWTEKRHQAADLTHRATPRKVHQANLVQILRG
ncbi:hypothetical protein RA086_09670 [Lactiplantibacillus sp. WILCCON 0030]|uniref:Secreted protein n=1 Tax=Lactiplantibacillus brownii TaxID=3069269 RepID=A0ABU1AA95_9LACO|nr:hypothetical protein [Lactiplantibacillus brownii]MDQ7937874.1 hypothetical protein [Lactiplantibacillus brownii]